MWAWLLVALPAAFSAPDRETLDSAYIQLPIRFWGETLFSPGSASVDDKPADEDADILAEQQFTGEVSAFSLGDVDLGFVRRAFNFEGDRTILGNILKSVTERTGAPMKLTRLLLAPRISLSDDENFVKIVDGAERCLGASALSTASAVAPSPPPQTTLAPLSSPPPQPDEVASTVESTVETPEEISSAAAMSGEEPVEVAEDTGSAEESSPEVEESRRRRLQEGPIEAVDGAFFDMDSVPPQAVVNITIISHEPAKIVLAEGGEEEAPSVMGSWSARKKLNCACQVIPESRENVMVDGQEFSVDVLALDCSDTKVEGTAAPTASPSDQLTPGRILADDQAVDDGPVIFVQRSSDTIKTPEELLDEQLAKEEKERRKEKRRDEFGAQGVADLIKGVTDLIPKPRPESEAESERKREDLEHEMELKLRMKEKEYELEKKRIEELNELQRKELERQQQARADRKAAEEEEQRHHMRKPFRLTLLSPVTLERDDRQTQVLETYQEIMKGRSKKSKAAWTGSAAIARRRDYEKIVKGEAAHKAAPGGKDSTFIERTRNMDWTLMGEAGTVMSENCNPLETDQFAYLLYREVAAQIAGFSL